MKKNILFCLLTFSAFSYAQDHNLQSSPTFSRGDFSAVSDGVNLKAHYIISSNDVNNIEGTHYLFPEWKGKFKVYTSEKFAYSIESLNYDILSKDLETKISKDTIFKFDISKIYLVDAEHSSYKFFTVNNKKELYQVFFSSNKILFLKGFDVGIIKGYFNPVTQQYEGKDKYKIYYKYLCKISNGEFSVIDLKKKSILKILGDKSKLVEKFASNSKLSFSSEHDLTEIFKYYDSL
jgi:hypothetical protein